MQDKLRWIKTFTFALVFIQSTLSSASVFSVTPKAGTTLPIELMSNSSHAADGATPYTYNGCGYQDASGGTGQTIANYTPVALTASSNRCTYCALTKKQAAAPVTVTSNTATATVNIALATTNPSNATVDSGQTATFSAAAFGGTAPYAYRVKTSVANMNRGVRQTTTHYTKAALTTSSTRYTYRAPVTDSATRTPVTNSAAVKKTSFNTAWLHPVVTVTGGLAIASIGQSDMSIPVELCIYHYDPSPVHSTQPLWGAFLGNEMHLSSSWLIDLGIGYYQPAAFSGAGTLIQGADVPSYNYYRYTYQVSTKQLLMEGKLLGRIREYIHPYLSLGAGATFNRSYAYETSVPTFFLYTPLFSNASQTNFSYALGVGVDFNIDNEWRLGTGYRFVNLGRANFGAAAIDDIPISGTLKQSYLYTNEILIQLTYVPLMN